MIWGVLWAVGVVAFLVFFFRGHLLWLLFWVLGLVGVIASAFLEQALMEYEGYGDVVGHVVETASRVGWIVVIVAGTVLVADIAVMTIYTIRQGQSDNLEGKVITENRPLSAMSLRIPPPMGWSKRKMLGSKSDFITMESLVDGTATFGERIMVVGIFTAFVSFFSIFVGAGLMLMEDLLIFVLFPVIPGIWLYRFIRETSQDYQEAKKRVAARRHGEQAAALSGERHQPHRERSEQS